MYVYTCYLSVWTAPRGSIRKRGLKTRRTPPRLTSKPFEEFSCLCEVLHTMVSDGSLPSWYGN